MVYLKKIIKKILFISVLSILLNISLHILIDLIYVGSDKILYDQSIKDFINGITFFVFIVGIFINIKNKK